MKTDNKKVVTIGLLGLGILGGALMVKSIYQNQKGPDEDDEGQTTPPDGSDRNLLLEKLAIQAGLVYLYTQSGTITRLREGLGKLDTVDWQKYQLLIQEGNKLWQQARSQVKTLEEYAKNDWDKIRQESGRKKTKPKTKRTKS